MAHLNIEIKAKTKDPMSAREYLKTNKAIFKGIDIQSDTYFNVFNGRLKLREGNIENNLILYERSDQPGAKESKFQLANVPDAKALKEVLVSSLGVRVVVKKKREIFFIENVKFHIDQVEGLGSFIEIEASDLYADVSKTELQKQCEFYIKEFRITQEDLVSVSYSDMMLALLK